MLGKAWGSVVLERLNRKRDDLMNEGKKLQNVGQWQQETVASEHRFLPFCALIASMSPFACLRVGQKNPACSSATAGLSCTRFLCHRYTI